MNDRCIKNVPEYSDHCDCDKCKPITPLQELIREVEKLREEIQTPPISGIAVVRRHEKTLELFAEVLPYLNTLNELKAKVEGLTEYLPNAGGSMAHVACVRKDELLAIIEGEK